MNEQELRNLLEKLRDEIESTKSVDEQGRELLRELDEDIHDLLERSESEKEQLRLSMVRRLQDAIEQLEIDHPALTSILSQLSAILSNAGI
jgi:DNA anti-recombination protein RmuC